MGLKFIFFRFKEGTPKKSRLKDEKKSKKVQQNDQSLCKQFRRQFRERDNGHEIISDIGIKDKKENKRAG